MKKILFLYGLLLFWACSASVFKPVQSDADRGASKFPGLTLASLQEGRSLYEASCGNCHELYKPAFTNEDGWRKIVPVMAEKAKIDDKSEQLVLQYVVTMSGATR